LVLINLFIVLFKDSLNSSVYVALIGMFDSER
jgi:hypothetical protein